MGAGFVGRQGLYQSFRIERGPQDEKRAVGPEGLDSNDDMRNITISVKNFADIKMVFLAFNKPALIAVVPAFEVERSGIRSLGARMGDHAQIRQPAESQFQVSQDLRQMLGVGQLIIRDFIHGESQGIQPLLQKKGHRPPGVGSQPFGAQYQLRIHGFLKQPVMNNGDHQQGHQGGDHQHKRYRSPRSYDNP